MALNPRNLKPGEEQYESYRSNVAKRDKVQYDYRHFDGQLFSCVKNSLEECWDARDKWLSKIAN